MPHFLRGGQLFCGQLFGGRGAEARAQVLLGGEAAVQVDGGSTYNK